MRVGGGGAMNPVPVFTPSAPRLGGQPVCWWIYTSMKNVGVLTETLAILDAESLWSFDALIDLWTLFLRSARSRSYKLFCKLCFQFTAGM